MTGAGAYHAGLITGGVLAGCPAGPGLTTTFAELMLVTIGSIWREDAR